MTDGFLKKEIVPFPRSHFQEVGLPADLSVKRTSNGLQPLVGVAIKSALSWACVKVKLTSDTINKNVVFKAIFVIIGLGHLFGWMFALILYLCRPNNITPKKLKNCDDKERKGFIIF